MIEKAGEIIAIDQVFHNASLSGNGRPDSPLGIATSAGNWISLSSNNTNINWKKIDGRGIKFNAEKPILIEDSVYDINTTVVITNNEGVPDFNEYTLIIDGNPLLFNHDMSNPVSSVYSFDTIYKATETHRLETELSAKNKDYASYTIIQNIHDIVTVGGDVSEKALDKVYVNTPISGDGTEANPIGLINTWETSVNNIIKKSVKWDNTTKTVDTNSASWNETVKTVSENADTWNTVSEGFNASAALWNDSVKEFNTSATIWNSQVIDFAIQKQIWNSQISSISASAINWNTIPALPASSSGTMVIKDNVWSTLKPLENVIIGEGLTLDESGTSAVLSSYITTLLNNGILQFNNSVLLP